MKVVIWAKSPSPHQLDFYEALRKLGVDLSVLYLETLPPARLALGWHQPQRLVHGECVAPHGIDPFKLVPDWRERVHVIPGYSRAVFRRAAVYLARAGVPWVHWSERSWPSWRSYLSWAVKRWYASLVNRSALGALAQGDLAERDFVRWGIRPEKIAHLYYAVRGIDNQTAPDEPTRQFIAGRTSFVFVGRLARHKGSDVLLRAFAEIRPESRNVSLVLVGEGPQAARCRQIVDTFGLRDYVLFRGVLPCNSVGSVLLASQVLVLPSRYDGWGVVLNEASSAGLALIASDHVGAANHLVEPGINGFRVRAGSVSSLAAAMSTYASDPGLSAAHGACSRLLFQRFSPDWSAARFVATIYSWLATRPEWAPFRADWVRRDPAQSLLTSAA
jgi:glycosyltransferase involved in cell wall biosynthesis